MPKRKLSDIADDAIISTNTTTTRSYPPPNQLQTQLQNPNKPQPNLKLQKTRLKAKFDLGVTALSRALKAARGSERQKLGRRQKTAREGVADKDGKGSEEMGRRIEAEIKVLKELDPTSTAEKYLFKQLVKTKRIAEAPMFKRFKQSKKISLEGPKSTEEANVTARLFKSTPVKNVLPGIMEGLRGLFGLEAAGAGGNKNGGSDKVKDSRPQIELGQRRGESGVSDERSGDEARDVDVDMDMDVEDAESAREDYSGFDARLGSDSEDDDASDEGLPRKKSNAPPPRSSMSISLSPEPEPSPEKKQKPSSKTKPSTAPATSTTFLPSLMMGGYWSGSESEAEEIDEAPVRRNRMGQQARRALWEKKYGASANHVKDEEKKRGNKKGRDSGWDARKGATGDGDGGRRKFGTGSNAMAMTGKSRMPPGNETQRGSGAGKKPQDDKPLHPSWEAARKAKEQKASASFSGKKVVFD
ncbi:Bud-site selection protein [Aspergillus cavernicola]|uniref:Bud-site selection protein n=1 Tax=Aspergillus cavernicola TaxID=176166 RepID=A0ABR4HTE5_9EURO